MLQFKRRIWSSAIIVFYGAKYLKLNRFYKEGNCSYFENGWFADLYIIFRRLYYMPFKDVNLSFRHPAYHAADYDRIETIYWR